MKAILTSIAASTLFAAFTVAQAPPFGATKVFNLEPPTHGNPEGIAFDPASRAFFVGATWDGAIYRGALDGSTATEFIPGAPGMEAAGMKVAGGKLYVAGGFSGAVRVYEIATKKLVASFGGFGAGMLNDLVVTRTGDVFVTDSFLPTLWRITAAMVTAGGGTPEGVPVDPEIEYVADPHPFNLNGIVALNGGRRLIVVQTNTRKLFRIDFNEDAPSGRTIHEIDVEPLDGDGLLLDKGLLIAVTFPATLTFVRLDDNAERGEVVERRSDATLREPSTVARARGFYLVVNPDWTFGRTPFTVTGLPRNDDEDEE
jgi:sugar lactone lactonase YvrE